MIKELIIISILTSVLAGEVFEDEYIDTPTLTVKEVASINRQQPRLVRKPMDIYIPPKHKMVKTTIKKTAVMQGCVTVDGIKYCREDAVAKTTPKYTHLITNEANIGIDTVNNQTGVKGFLKRNESNAKLISNGVAYIGGKVIGGVSWLANGIGSIFTSIGSGIDSYRDK